MVFQKGHKINLGRKNSPQQIENIKKGHKSDCRCYCCKAKRGELAGKNNGTWKGDDVGYKGKHYRIIKLKGKASEYKCIDCPNQARDWSNVDHLYSLDPDDYQPRCTSCHRKYDNKLQKK